MFCKFRFKVFHWFIVMPSAILLVHFKICLNSNHNKAEIVATVIKGTNQIVNVFIMKQWNNSKNELWGPPLTNDWFAVSSILLLLFHFIIFRVYSLFVADLALTFFSTPLENYYSPTIYFMLLQIDRVWPNFLYLKR